MNGPALITAVALLLYWGQVMRMARRARRRRGRSANLIPAERIGWWLRWLWTPVVLLWVAIPAARALRVRPPLRVIAPLYFLPPLQWAAAGGVCLMFVASLRCWRAMGRSWRMGINPAETTPLVTAGPFAWVRHPIYALSQGMMICTFLAVPSLAMLIVGSIHIFLLHWEAHREERHLLRVHGSVYQSYRSAVGRFVPRRLGGYVPAPA